MADLAVRLGSLELKNPVIVASSPLTQYLWRVKEAEAHGAAAVCTKHTFYFQPFRGRSRWYVDKKVGMVVCSDERVDLPEGVKAVRETKAQTGLKVLANMSGAPDNLEAWALVASSLEEAGADALELNLNCPNLTSASQHLRGGRMGADPDSAARVVARIRKAVKIPITAKLITDASDVVAVARACEEAGADMLTIHAGFRAAPGLDIYNRGKPLMAGMELTNFGGHVGPWSRLITNRFIAETASATSIPIIGGGGMSRWEHVVEAMMYGAGAIQMCYYPMWNGWKFLPGLLSKLNDYLDKQGYRSLEDVRGLALKYVATPDKLTYKPIVARVTASKCTGCDYCVRLGACEAIVLKNKLAVIDPEECYGCQLCVGLCPTKAIYMEEVDYWPKMQRGMGFLGDDQARSETPPKIPVPMAMGIGPTGAKAGGSSDTR